ncbi:YvzF family protein [Sutcliffiella halmapala]|uniref:YvzF family protein n=1 Tax=Sutcliffiella halmapala TaxID=79882 RepID=UPI000994C2E3|nr:YvzF family protein [Sutcliffiella halmapala]
MVKIRLSGTKQEMDTIIRSFEQNYCVQYVSKDYASSKNPKYKSSKDVRIYLELGMKDK